MTITIIEERIYQDELGNDEGHHVDIVISDGTDHYQLGVGGLPLEGNFQPILEAREAELWEVAQTINNQLTIEEVRAVLYNSPIAGGWTPNEFQEAYNENFGGNSTKLRRLRDRRDAIRDEWPYNVN